MRLVQFEVDGEQRAVGLVSEKMILRIEGVSTVRELALRAIAAGTSIAAQVELLGVSTGFNYQELLSSGRILPPLDHPDSAHCLVAGTGLTHMGSAAARDEINRKSTDKAQMSDSMRMFKMGLDAGKPIDGQPGVQPEWFYKGDGSIVARPGQPLSVPTFACDMGEEPEVVGLYVVSQDGRPYRVGFAVGNEATDHVMEKVNYLYLPHSKLRSCSYGPEILIGELPSTLVGQVRIRRDGEVVWQKDFLTGEDNMCHSLANLEYHHFKYDQFLIPGSVHVQFMGTSTASFGDGFKTQDNDVFEMEIPDFGLPLINGMQRVEPRIGFGKVAVL